MGRARTEFEIMPKAAFEETLKDLQVKRDMMMREMSKVIIGQKAVLSEILAAVFSRAHCLLVGVPGLAKTRMVRAIAEILDLTFKRIQFTPDLMPSDITGTNVIEEDPETGGRDYKFLPGPVFAHIVLADEINRTPPKTQAALLEAMQELQVSVGKVTYELPAPFFVIATQNPIEQEGTYPLPEAQLDRFMFSIYIDYPAEDEEQEIFRSTTRLRDVRLSPVLGAEAIEAVQDTVDRVAVSDHVVRYVSDLVRSTRPPLPESPPFIKEMVRWGAGPRAGQYLIRGAKAFAAMDGRPNAGTDDVRRVAVLVLRHRLGLNFRAEAAGVDSVKIVRMLLEAIEVPAPRG